MCGICGFISKGVKRREAVQRMLEQIRHRGPDNTGLWEDDLLTLGHNRLSIIDLSEHGRQPMIRGKWVIVYNGEVYNYKEIKEELQLQYNQIFETETDTEVILAAWDVWGLSALERFRGMWAFALYDRVSNEMILSRDRFGIKPLYYYVNESDFLFASEIKALLVDSSIPRKACLSIISDYLLVGFQDHRAETFFEGIMQVPPGHYLIMNSRDRKICVESYYDLATRIQGRRSTINEFESVFKESIKLHLRSDVPVGTCLSGGIDSSSVATLAAGIYKSKSKEIFQAVTAKSSDPSNNESEFARIVANNSGIKWHLVEPSPEDFKKYWEHCLWHQDEPSGGPSIFMQYWVMKKAKEVGLKVMLDGQGGDECLLGYERYYSSFFLYLLRKFLWGRFFSEFLAASENSKLTSKELFLYFFYFLSSNIREFILKKNIRGFPPELIKETFARLGESIKSYRNPQTMQVSEITFFQLPHLLKYEDRNSMAWSVEARVPFIDHEVVEIALSLEPEDKIRNGYTKWALRQIMNTKMADAITWRKNKIAFEAPTSYWVAGNIEWIMEIIKESVIIKELGIYSKTNNQNVFMRIFNLAHWESIYHVQM